MGGIIIDSNNRTQYRLLQMKNRFFTFLVFLVSSITYAQHCGGLTISSLSPKIIEDRALELNFINLCMGETINLTAESQNN